MAAERMRVSHWQVRNMMYLVVHPHRRAREAVLLLQGSILQEDGARGLRRRLQALTRHSVSDTAGCSTRTVWTCGWSAQGQRSTHAAG
jgi:hypothetical protein